MKREGYTEEQMTLILREHPAGVSVPDLAHRHDLIENTIDRSSPEYGYMKSWKPRHYGNSNRRMHA